MSAPALAVLPTAYWQRKSLHDRRQRIDAVTLDGAARTQLIVERMGLSALMDWRESPDCRRAEFALRAIRARVTVAERLAAWRQVTA
jgi:hypothetical protein